tara:strand:+ start:704 stop:1135 length:432 start_codon:yes stop_codon:yes gene_type:complete
MMQINVSQLLKEAIGSVRNYEISGIADITGDGSDSVVNGKVKLMRTNRSVLVKAALHTEVKVSCSRCLSLFSYPLGLNTEEEYFPILDVSTGVSSVLQDGSDCFIINEYHIIDLTEMVRQYGLIGIPMKPLCREDCIGLKVEL